MSEVPDRDKSSWMIKKMMKIFNHYRFVSGESNVIKLYVHIRLILAWLVPNKLLVPYQYMENTVAKLLNCDLYGKHNLTIS